jgi:hypothetical protein
MDHAGSQAARFESYVSAAQCTSNSTGDERGEEGAPTIPLAMRNSSMLAQLALNQKVSPLFGDA